MARRGTGSRRAAGCLITSAGAVGAATAGHVSAGGARPASLVLVLLVPLLAGPISVLPKRIRTVRGQILAAAVLQPVLHVVFQLAPAHADGPTRVLGAGLLVMLPAHAAAGLATMWCLRRADQLVDAAVDLAAVVSALFRALVPLVPIRPPLRCPEIERPSAGRIVAAALAGRSPPTGLTAVLPG